MTRGPFEAVLRDLVRDEGPSIRKLTIDEEPARTVMAAVESSPAWSVEDKAGAILKVITELITQMNNPRWKAAAQAAFRVPVERYQRPEFDSLTARWREAAREDPGHDADEAADRYRGYWRTSAAAYLARALEARITELNGTAGWARYHPREMGPTGPVLPIVFERTDVLYQFEGRRGMHSTSQRWVRATGPIDHYEVAGWYYSDPDAKVEIIPVANCLPDGPPVLLPQGGRAARLTFSRQLREGDRYYFSYRTQFNSEKECRPTILYEVRGLHMDVLVVRAQFDRGAVPVKCWYFDIGTQAEGWREPDDGAPEILEISAHGYTDHEFRDCRYGRKYGLRWIWPAQDEPAPPSPGGGSMEEG